MLDGASRQYYWHTLLRKKCFSNATICRTLSINGTATKKVSRATSLRLNSNGFVSGKSMELALSPWKRCKKVGRRVLDYARNDKATTMHSASLSLAYVTILVFFLRRWEVAKRPRHSQWSWTKHTECLHRFYTRPVGAIWPCRVPDRPTFQHHRQATNDNLTV